MLILIAILLVIIGWKQIVTFIATVLSALLVVFVITPVVLVIGGMVVISEAIFGSKKP